MYGSNCMEVNANGHSRTITANHGFYYLSCDLKELKKEEGKNTPTKNGIVLFG